jgi:hypothetical protein
MNFMETANSNFRPPYTANVVALLWRHCSDGSLALFTENLIVQGIHEPTEENRDEIIERARIARLEKWPDKARPPKQWEFVMASVGVILVR